MEQRLYAMYPRTGEIPGLPSTLMAQSDRIRIVARWGIFTHQDGFCSHKCLVTGINGTLNGYPLAE